MRDVRKEGRKEKRGTGERIRRKPTKDALDNAGFHRSFHYIRAYDLFKTLIKDIIPRRERDKKQEGYQLFTCSFIHEIVR